MTTHARDVCSPARGEVSPDAKAHRMTATYGAAHKRARARWRNLVLTGQATCSLCGQPLEPHLPWDLDHLPGTDQYRGPSHPSCNRADGARRGNAMRVVPSAPRASREW